jgi:hypothetical protein
VAAQPAASQKALSSMKSVNLEGTLSNVSLTVSRCQTVTNFINMASRHQHYRTEHTGLFFRKVAYSKYDIPFQMFQVNSIACRPVAGAADS